MTLTMALWAVLAGLVVALAVRWFTPTPQPPRPGHADEYLRRSHDRWRANTNLYCGVIGAFVVVLVMFMTTQQRDRVAAREAYCLSTTEHRIQQRDRDLDGIRWIEHQIELINFEPVIVPNGPLTQSAADSDLAAAIVEVARRLEDRKQQELADLYDHLEEHRRQAEAYVAAFPVPACDDGQVQSVPQTVEEAP